MAPAEGTTAPSREYLLHMLYEAAELEHNLMCTYLYAAFSLKSGTAEGLSEAEAEAVEGIRKAIVNVAIDEMGHLSAVWNITAALGGAPRFGRGNFPLDAGSLPAAVIVKLAPFNAEVLQHFIHLERPSCSSEPDGAGFAPETLFQRGFTDQPRITPMPIDYDTVGAFYDSLSASLQAFVEAHGESVAFCGDPALQLSPAEVDLAGARPVICLKTALNAFRAIVEQGEGAAADAAGSHYQSFLGVRAVLNNLVAQNPSFVPAFPAATNPVLRRPMGRVGRVWLENERAASTVDVANSAYALMLRLLAYSYVVPRPDPTKTLAIELGMTLMRGVTWLGEHAARLPVGPSHPDCNAGMSFTALRDAAALLPGPSAGRFFTERLAELAAAAARLEPGEDGRVQRSLALFRGLVERAERGFAEAPRHLPLAPASAVPAAASPAPVQAAPVPTKINGSEYIEGQGLTLIYEGKRCIHARFCVTGAPGVFVANVVGPWIHPDAIPTERLVEIAHACPSGAIRYTRKDGEPDEAAPPVNLLSIRESEPYAVRAGMNLAGKTGEYRATLCRCGASKNKPYCDGSHHDVHFEATGEPATVSGSTDMLPERGGELSVEPMPDGPLAVRGNLEITSGTGRVVARLTSARLCRCGASANKPFCDGSHARVGFRSTND